MKTNAEQNHLTDRLENLKREVKRLRNELLSSEEHRSLLRQLIEFEQQLDDLGTLEGFLGCGRSWLRNCSRILNFAEMWMRQKAVSLHLENPHLARQLRLLAGWSALADRLISANQAEQKEQKKQGASALLGV